jgi:exportin-2 (importin alpha re-exporter)
MIEQNTNDLNAIQLIFSSLILICKIFRSLNSQDFPEEFEDTMDIWMTHFLTLLVYDNTLLHSQVFNAIFFKTFIIIIIMKMVSSFKKGEEAGLLEQVKSQICDNISLFAQNYSENFGDYLPKFVTAVWNLLVTTSLETKYDLVRKY